MTKVMISCGEASGDLYAAALATELRRLDGGTQLFGLGGPRMAGAGARLVAEYSRLTVTGLTEVLRVLPRTLATYRQLVAAAERERPDVLVAVDFPDFNFRLAAALRRLGVPIVYYVSPQVWAWRPGRLKTMRRFVDRALVIFPFEAPLYREAGIPVTFVGHPLVDLARPTQPRSAFRREAGLDPQAPVVALLPGSRPNELRALLPTLVEAADRIGRRVPSAQFVVARAPGLASELFAPLAQLGAQRLPASAVIEGRADDVLAAADAVVTASGTATVQAALHERPMVIVYRVSPITYYLGRPLVHVDTYGMVNLVAGERIVPELIQGACTPDRVADETIQLLTDRPRAEQVQGALRRVRELLGSPGASRRAAESVLAVAWAKPGVTGHTAAQGR